MGCVKNREFVFIASQGAQCNVRWKPHSPQTKRDRQHYTVQDALKFPRVPGNLSKECKRRNERVRLFRRSATARSSTLRSGFTRRGVAVKKTVIKL